MRIAITGARGGVGRVLVQECSKAGHHVVQINRTEQAPSNVPNTEMRTADVAQSYQQTVDAFRDCDAVIHLAAIPNPVDKEDHLVHNNNVNSAFNGFRAAAELGIERICYASSVNAIGLAFSNQPLHFDYFPLDEKAPQHPTDSYALAKKEAEIQAQAFAEWYPGMKIACLRIHQVAPRSQVREAHQTDWSNSAVKQLWGWVNPNAVARACLMSVENCDNWQGCEVFNITAPSTTQEIPSVELAQKHYPNTEIRGDMSGNQSFWTTDKAERILGWVHHETE